MRYLTYGESYPRIRLCCRGEASCVRVGEQSAEVVRLHLSGSALRPRQAEARSTSVERPGYTKHVINRQFIPLVVAHVETAL